MAAQSCSQRRASFSCPCNDHGSPDPPIRRNRPLLAYATLIPRLLPDSDPSIPLFEMAGSIHKARPLLAP